MSGELQTEKKYLPKERRTAGGRRPWAVSRENIPRMDSASSKETSQNARESTAEIMRDWGRELERHFQKISDACPSSIEDLVGNQGPKSLRISAEA